MHELVRVIVLFPPKQQKKQEQLRHPFERLSFKFSSSLLSMIPTVFEKKYYFHRICCLRLFVSLVFDKRCLQRQEAVVEIRARQRGYAQLSFDDVSASRDVPATYVLPTVPCHSHQSLRERKLVVVLLPCRIARQKGKLGLLPCRLTAVRLDLLRSDTTTKR